MTFQLAPDAQTYDCRKAFADTLIELARSDERIVAVCNDSVEDLSWTRAIDNLNVLVPADPVQTRAAVR
jgi:transketolase C-terminal domain/subunit